MTPNRRDFVKAGAVAAAATIVGPQLLVGAAPRRVIARSTEFYADDLILEALSAAKDAGAQYADARVGRYRRQSLNTREHQITGVADAESYGIGVRTLVDGSWGFSATANMTKDAVVRCARDAVRLSRAAKSTQRRPVELAPTAPVKGTWITPVVSDPIDVPIEEKVALLFATNEAALKVPAIRFCTSGLQLLREVKTLGTTEGTLITQTFIRSEASFSATAAGGGNTESYTEELPPRSQGWEYIESLNLPGPRRRVGAGRRRKALGENGRSRTLRSHSPAHESLAHDPRVHRASDRARSGHGLRGELRRHELREPAGEDDRQAQVRSAAHEHPGRPHAGPFGGPLRVGRRRRSRRQMADHRQGNLQGVSDHARAGRVGRAAHRHEALTRLLVRRLVGLGAVPADAERLAAARRRRTSRSTTSSPPPIAGS